MRDWTRQRKLPFAVYLWPERWDVLSMLIIMKAQIRIRKEVYGE